MWWSVSVMTALHLWWLTSFLGELFQAPLLGVLAFALYALEGGFFALMAYLVARAVQNPHGRVWALAGGWLLTEALRFLGPLAFPWPTLGSSLLPTPLIQIADLGGVLLASGLIVTLAAALAGVWTGWGRRDLPWRPLALTLLAWGAALSYGLTRTPGEGPEQPMRVLRTEFDSFARATQALSPEAQFAQQLPASLGRPPGSVVVWSETALLREAPPQTVPDFPGPGLSGLRTFTPDQNSVIAIGADGQVTSRNLKARLVPFGEEFPFYRALRPVYAVFERALGFEFGSLEPARQVTPLTLGGVRYGTYVCYDSVFPWVARQLTRAGAQVLVNPSNDGWYAGWGVEQHFWMGRVRAIEQRRWLVRSVNAGVAGSVNDLGQPVQLLRAGGAVQALDVRPKLLSGLTVYAHVGDAPAYALAFALMLGGVWTGRRPAREE
ncbi:apolipoprotein N-acyltransferase [Deinococcus reticulitermitis]|uniref:Apolipoprotein N-acyltransferase n=2 Tax=Deinococcus reticulitermitis TaxID=856736 RepID=A0A1H7A9P7_9DEIO|nr:apolipoprotein N-acyltransferase [Deinococcus reticulitermitis]